MLSGGGSDLACGWCAAEARVGAVDARVHSVQATGADALAEPVAHNRVGLGPLWSSEDDQRLVHEVLLETRIMVVFSSYRWMSFDWYVTSEKQKETHEQAGLVALLQRVEDDRRAKPLGTGGRTCIEGIHLDLVLAMSLLVGDGEQASTFDQPASRV